MRKVIVGIHGLGNKTAPSLLEKWWLLSMREGLERHYGGVKKLPEFKMVYWADVMHNQPLDATLTNKGNPRYVDEPYAPGTGAVYRDEHYIRKKVIDFINEQLDKVFLNDDLSINYSFIADPLIRKYFFEMDAYFRNEFVDKSGTSKRVKDILHTRLREVLEFHRNDEILLIGHSMGSIIAYEVLATLPEDINVNTFITIGSPLGLPIIKSRVSAWLRQNGSERILPRVPEAVKSVWYNFSDIEDNVALNYKLSDDFLPNKSGVGVTDFEVENDYIFNNHKNAHKVYGYLRTPELSKVIHDFIPMQKEAFTQKVVSWIAGKMKGR